MEQTARVKAYLDGLPPDAKRALTSLRRAIRAAAPRATEGFSYGVPAFLLDGRPIVCYAAMKNHCGFYPMSPGVMKASAKELKEYDTSKGTIRFAPSRALPASLVRTIVRRRIADMTARKA